MKNYKFKLCKRKKRDKCCIQPIEMVSQRKTITEAENYFVALSDTVQDKEAKFVMFVAFYILWNTIARNYDVYLKDQEEC